MELTSAVSDSMDKLIATVMNELARSGVKCEPLPPSNPVDQ